MNILLSVFKLLADDRVKVALGAFALSLLAIAGVTQEKQDQVMKLIYAGCGLAGAIIVGISYEKGKSAEGTVPDGSRSVYDSVASAVPIPDPSAPPAAPSSTANAAPSATPQPTQVAATTVKQVLPSLILLLLCMIPLFAGCQASPAFIGAVKQVGPHIATDAQHYVDADTAITAQEKASRTAAIQRFSAATTNVISNGDVANAWAAVRSWYQIYVDADPALDFNERSIREQRITGFDAVIQHDTARPLSLVPVAPPTPLPSTQPATQPTTQP